MYALIPISNGNCLRGMASEDCAINDLLSNQRLLHKSAYEPREILAGGSIFSAVAQEYTKLFGEINKACANCVHNRSK